MFTKQDYARYFDEIGGLLQEALVIYTDLLNELKDEAVHNKLYAITTDTMDAFTFIKEQKEKFA